MSIDTKEDKDLASNNPLLRKTTQLRLAAARNIEEAGAEGSLKLGVDLLREEITADTIDRHLGAKRENILKGIIQMWF